MLRWPDAVAWLHIPRTQPLRIFHSWCPFYLPEGDGCGSRHSPLPGPRSRQAVTSPACVRARPSAQPPQQSARRINCLNATTQRYCRDSWRTTRQSDERRAICISHLISSHTRWRRKKELDNRGPNSTAGKCSPAFPSSLFHLKNGSSVQLIHRRTNAIRWTNVHTKIYSYDIARL